MRDSPVALALAAVLFIVGASALAAFVKSRNQPLYIATPRLIAADPDFWFEKSVRLKTSSMEVFLDASGQRELRYREATNKPFSVIVRGKIPEKVPEELACHCEGNQDGATILTCR